MSGSIKSFLTNKKKSKNLEIKIELSKVLSNEIEGKMYSNIYIYTNRYDNNFFIEYKKVTFKKKKEWITFISLEVCLNYR